VLKAAAVLVAGVLAGALFVVLRPEGERAAPATAQGDEVTTTATSDAPTTTQAAAPQLTRINIRVRNGRPVGGVARVELERGRRVELVVTSDVADHVHVHGHDLFADVAPGQPVRFRFRATIPGRIEVELEDTHTLLAELSVRP
jgi:FtsP/CotA-like multicopper oxidase with cupredoxin domain